MTAKKYDGAVSGGETTDGWLILISGVLAVVGCLFVYSLTAEPSEQTTSLVRNIIFAVTGFISMLIISKVDYHYLRMSIISFYGVAVVLCLVYSFAGQNGEIRAVSHYIIVWNISVHVSSFLFVATCLVFAVQLSRGRNILIFTAIGCVSCSLFLFALYDVYYLLAMLLVIMVTSVFVSKKWLTGLLGTATVLSVVLLFFLQNGRPRGRIEAWLNPFSDPYGFGYETIQNLYAIASGGPLGVGYGNGTEKYFLPVAVLQENVLAGISQEIGFLGAFAILLLLVGWALRAVRIALRSADRLGFFLSAMIIFRFMALVLLHTMSATNAIPHLTLPLPFISSTGVTMEFVLSGILLNISRYQSIMVPKDR